MRILLFESYNNILKYNNRDLVVFHGTSGEFTVDEFKTNDIGYHFGNIRQAWNFAESAMRHKHRYSGEMGLLYGIDYTEIIKSYKLKGNFMDFIDLELWKVRDFIKAFDDLVRWSGDNNLAYNTRLSPYDNLNRTDIKLFCGATDPYAPLDGIRYMNEYDSNTTTKYDDNKIRQYLSKKGFTDDEINMSISVANDYSYLVFNKQSIIPYKN